MSGGFFDPDKLKSEILDLSKKTDSETLWNNPDTAQNLLQKKASLEKALSDYEALESNYNHISELFELDPEDTEIAHEIQKLSKQTHTAKFITLFNQPNDKSSAFLFIQAGAGGTEAQDWASMLARMYSRWAERHGFKVETIHEHPGDTAGLKSITFKIS